jgi:hypothetical protein
MDRKAKYSEPMTNFSSIITVGSLLAVSTALSACQTLPAVISPTEEPCAFEGKLSSFHGEYAALPSGEDTFTTDTQAIFFTTFVAAGCCEVAGVYWLYEGEVLEQQVVSKTDTENFIAYAVFMLPRTETGYLPGEYTVLVFQGGTESGRANFTVVE